LNGNVGIGDTNPLAKLQIGTPANATGGMSTTFSAYSGNLGSTIGNTINLASFGFGPSNTTALGIQGYRTATGSTYTESAIGIGMAVDNAFTPHLWFHNNDNIGIGTMSPLAAAHINESSAVGVNAYPLFVTNNAAEDSIGVGMTFSTPNATTSGNRNWSIGANIANYGNFDFLTSVDSTSDPSDPKMSITRDGYVGIGKIDPTYKLAVSGTVAADGIRSDMGFDIYPVPDPTAPTGVVSAGGSVDTGTHWYSVSYTTATGETQITYTAAVITTTAGNNTVTLTIPVSTDPRVTGRKIYRSKANQPQYSDYFVATVANNTATSYVDTVADSTLTVGPAAGFFRLNTTSAGLTIGGVNSLNIGGKSIHMGIGTGSTVTTGGRNTLIGAQSATRMTIGGNNTLVGAYIAGPSTGSQNTLIGTFAGSGITTAGNNTLVGTYAMESVSGGFNSAFGANSGLSVTTGTYNTFIGESAGYNGSQLISATNSTALGYGAYTTASNQVVIGNTSVTQTLLRGSVGINGTPTAKLHLPAGAAAASSAPLKFTSGTNLTTTEAGAIEYNGAHLYFTATNGGTRYQLDQQSGGSTTWDTIGDATANGSIQFSSFTQTMDWDSTSTATALSLTGAVLSTGKLLSLTANVLTSGTLLDINSSGTAGLTGQKGLNIALSGTNATTTQTTYGAYISNAHAGALSTSVGLYVSATGGTSDNYAAIFANGDVGIGTTTPSEKLDVNGNINFSATTSTTGMIKQGGVDIFHTYGTQNLFVGYDAGNFTLTGQQNTSIGYQAMNSMTTGSYNTAVGLQALYSGNSSENSAFGRMALMYATGSYNSGLGNTSLGGPSFSGSHNVGIGKDAGRTLTSGGTNTFIGYAAGYNGSQLATATNSMGLGNGAYTTASNQVMLGNASITHTILNGAVGMGLGYTAPAATRLDILDTTTTGTLVQVIDSSLTTGIVLSLVSSATTSITTAGTNIGSLLNIEERGAMTAFTGSLANISASGANAVGATGNALNINIAGTAQLMKGIKFSSTSTGNFGTTSTSGANVFSMNGNHSGIGFKIYDVTTTGIAFSVSDSAAMTAGAGISVALTGLAAAGSTTSAAGIMVTLTGTSYNTQRFMRFTNTAGTEIGSINNTNATTVAYATTSDSRLKGDIVETHFGLNDLMNVGVKDFTWNIDGTPDTGFIAQELYEVYPNAVTKGDNGTDPYIEGVTNTWSIDYGRVTPLIVKSIQDMNLKLLEINDMEKENDWRDSLNIWFANTSNGITEFIAGTVRAKDQLCIGEGSDAVCVTKEELLNIKNNANISTTTPEVIYIQEAPTDIPPTDTEDGGEIVTDISTTDTGGEGEAQSEIPPVVESNEDTPTTTETTTGDSESEVVSNI
jgi:hypothetical protein